MELPHGMIVSILNSGTYLTGTFQSNGKMEVMADDVRVESDRSLKELVVAKLPKTTVYRKEEETIVGYMQSSNSERVTLSLDDGGTVQTKYSYFVTDPYKTYSFEVEAKRTFQLQMRYEEGVDYEILSRVISSSDTAYVVQQQLRLTNNLPADLVDVSDLQISFQDRRRQYSAPMAMASRAQESKRASLMEDIAEEVATPISMGKLELIPKRSTITFEPWKPITLSVKNLYTDVSLDSSSATRTLELAPKEATLYPSNVLINKPTTNTPIASFNVPLQLKGGSFETSLGSSTGTTIKELVSTEKGYKLTIQSNITRPQKVRITGWKLEGRKDVYDLAPGTTKTFTGEYPKRLSNQL